MRQEMVAEDHKLWRLMEESWEALRVHYLPVMVQLGEEAGLAPRLRGVCFSALTQEPEFLTVADLLVRHPYNAAEVYQERIDLAVQAGLIEESEPGKFLLSINGREVVNRMVKEARQVMASVDPLSAESGERLTRFVGRLVEACHLDPPPPNHWTLDLSYRLIPEASPALPFIEQCITCLMAYRDDSHLAAWDLSGVSAIALEVLTVFWRNEIDTFDALCRRMAARGHECRVYEDTVGDFLDRGYLEGDQNSLRISEAGRYFRNMIETDTDRFFFTPWSCLSVEEKVELKGLLQRLRDGLIVKVA